MSDFSEEDVKEVAEIVLEIENRSISEKINSQGGKVAAFSKNKIDVDVVDEILNEVLGWGKKK